MASPVYNSALEEEHDNQVVEGFHVLGTSALLDVDLGAGSIDGRTVAATVDIDVTGATTGSKFRAYLITEDGDGTYTVTLGTDDLDTSALAEAEMLTLAVPAGGVAILAGVATDTTAVAQAKSTARQGEIEAIVG